MRGLEYKKCGDAHINFKMLIRIFSEFFQMLIRILKLTPKGDQSGRGSPIF